MAYTKAFLAKEDFSTLIIIFLLTLKKIRIKDLTAFFVLVYVFYLGLYEVKIRNNNSSS
jgi:hypothetical protein